MPTVILTIIGPDRPGLVRSLSEALVAQGGNWLESRMARLAGHFAGIVMVEAPEGFLAGLAALEVEGLRITATPIGALAAVAPPGPRLMLEVVCNDRPGIVHEVTRVLAAGSANIEEMTTTVASGAFSGDSLFRATIVLRAPSATAADLLSAGLERLGPEMMVDVQKLEG